MTSTNSRTRQSARSDEDLNSNGRNKAIPVHHRSPALLPRRVHSMRLFSTGKTALLFEILRESPAMHRFRRTVKAKRFRKTVKAKRFRKTVSLPVSRTVHKWSRDGMSDGCPSWDTSPNFGFA